MKIKHLDGRTLEVVRTKMEEALATLEEIGIHAQTGHISYQSQNATVKVEISVLGEGGEVVDKEALDYDRYRELHDLPERGTTFTSRGHTYTITGFKPRSSKYPVIASRADGRSFKFPIDTVAPERPSVRAMRLSEGMMEDAAN
jgi:hypothetical protein